MRGDHYAKFLSELQSFVKLAVIDSKSSLVGEEDFEGLDARGDDFAELNGRILVEFRHAHMKGVVTSSFSLRLRPPCPKALGGLHDPRRAAHIEDRRRSPD